MNFLTYHPQPLPGTAVNLVTSAVSGVLSLSKGKPFRLISTVDCYIRQSKSTNSVAATTADILLPAGSPMVILMGDYDEITCRTVSGPGNLGAVQIQPPI